jgi:hypothetical protein
MTIRPIDCEGRSDPAFWIGRLSIGTWPSFDNRDPAGLIEVRPFCLGIWHGKSFAAHHVPNPELMFLVGFGTDGNPKIPFHALDVSLHDERVALILVGGNLVERSDEANAGLDGQDSALE